jgi:hypothetical protein
MWPFPTGIPSIRKEMDPMRFVCTRLWAARGSADRKTLKEEQSQGSVEADSNKVAPASTLPDPVQTEKPKGQPVQLTLF